MCACFGAQGDQGACAAKLRRPHVARMPWAITWNWQVTLALVLGESVTCLTDYVGLPWRPFQKAPTEHHVSAYPTHCIGTVRAALYQKVMEHTPARPETLREPLFEAAAWVLARTKPWSVVCWRSVECHAVLQRRAHLQSHLRCQA